MKVLAPNVSHHFAGDHALGGTRHDRELVRRWFNRLGPVLPNLRFDVKNVWIKGPPWRTTVIAQWVATATLANGDPYVNPGVHIISIRWGKAYALDVSEDFRPWQRAWLNRPKRGSRKLRLPRSKADLAAPAIAVELDRNSCAPANVRFGSLADIGEGFRDVRFTPKSGHSSARFACPLSASSRHRQANRPPRLEVDQRTAATCRA